MKPDPRAGGRSALVFCMAQRGHFNRLRPLIAGLAAAGVPTWVFTDRCFRGEVEQSGGRFVDLFAGRPIEAADATSIPNPVRYVSFAGHFADEIIRAAAGLGPAVVVHDTFAVIGHAVANGLALPRVNVAAGHNFPTRPTAEWLQLPVLSISAECRRAAQVLEERYGIVGASPMSCYSAPSDDLNVYCEPAEFLPAEDHARFEPLAFFGSTPDNPVESETTATGVFGASPASKLRIYVSFGTVVWRYYEHEAWQALETICDAIALLDETVALVSLGGHGSTTQAAQLSRPNVRVEPYVDQWRVLREASVFITHQGLNSTHEAIVLGTPMISYPFFSDQPGLAKRCQEFGLAVPLVDEPRRRLQPADVHAALRRLEAGRQAVLASLETARRWEMRTIARRQEVIQRIVDLMR